MSDPQRPKRTTTKTSSHTADRNDREEISRMYHRGTPEKRRPPTNKQSWEIFDDLPEQRRRAPVRLSSAAAPQPARDILDEPDSTKQPRLSPIAQTRAALDQAETMRGPSWTASVPRPPLYRQTSGKPWLMLIIAAVSIGVIAMLMVPSRTVLNGSIFRTPAEADAPAAPIPEVIAPNGEHSILRAPSLTPEQIDNVLRDYGSPAVGTGRDWVALGEQYGIDPAYALAFFVVESSAGTAQGWAGWKGDGSSTHNIGNIICAGYPTCFGRFRDYGSWQEGIEDWYRLISVEYVGGRGLQTVEQIIPIYAPAFENDVDGYVANVEHMVADWRAK